VIYVSGWAIGTLGIRSGKDDVTGLIKSKPLCHIYVVITLFMLLLLSFGMLWHVFVFLCTCFCKNSLVIYVNLKRKIWK